MKAADQLSTTNRNCLGSYAEFLQKFLDKGYEFRKFSREPAAKAELILRHDIDFDIPMAHLAALAEKELGIQSTFFFLLRSDFYNPFSKANYTLIKEIKSMGHSISIHFDPVIYDDFNKGFEQELAYFKDVFDTEIDVISIHRPNEFFLKFDENIGGVMHTYQKRFFQQLKYYADSTGVWRFGNPLDSEEFNKLQSIQLLIHPIWWFTDGNNNLDVLTNHYESKKQELKQNFHENSIPFRKISTNV